MGEPEKRLTWAEQQIRRLEALRAQKEKESKDSLEKNLSSKTPAERSLKKLKALREKAVRPQKRKKLEGKTRKLKFGELQSQVLDRLKAHDSRLNAGVVIRIALNRFLDIDNSFDENDLEARVFEILRQFNSKP